MLCAVIGLEHRVSKVQGIIELFEGKRMTEDDRREFKEYLRNCTDRQVYGVLEKEKAAGREDYAQLARDELQRRGLS